MDQVTEISQKSAISIQDVVASTEEQLATSEEIASSSQLLAAMAEDLQKAIERFKI
ncbi:Methyl-accepting chemotaxis protein McpA [compost metagenome]